MASCWFSCQRLATAVCEGGECSFSSLSFLQGFSECVPLWVCAGRLLDLARWPSGAVCGHLASWSSCRRLAMAVYGRWQYVFSSLLFCRTLPCVTVGVRATSLWPVQVAILCGAMPRRRRLGWPATSIVCVFHHSQCLLPVSCSFRRVCVVARRVAV